MQVLTSLKEVLLDKVELTFVKVFWGKLFSPDGKEILKKAEEVKADLKASMSEADFELEISRRTRRCRLVLTKLPLEKLGSLHAGSSTIQKLWYNNNIVSMSEGEVGSFLEQNPKEVKIIVDEAFFKSSRRTGKVKKAEFKAGLLDQVMSGQMTLEEAQAEIAKVEAELLEKKEETPEEDKKE